MKLSVLGEFGFISRFSPPFLAGLTAGSVGIGDDCALIPWQGDKSLLVTTDMLIEDIHFLRDRIPPQDLGHKALAVNLSDIAAMGGKPGSCYLSLGIPPEIEVEWLDEFFVGLRQLAQRWDVKLLGGDTTKSPGPLVINLTVLGEVENRYVKLRSLARPGDIIAVTDRLGDSAGGLLMLLEGRQPDAELAPLLLAHHRPSPALVEGAWLARQEGVHALMDVSDGIDSDLQRIMERSLCGAEVFLEKLPVSTELTAAAGRFGWQALELAAAGGEDYCLLVTVSPDKFEEIKRGFQEIMGRPLYDIGRITAADTGLSYFLAGQAVKLGKTGFNHFT